MFILLGVLLSVLHIASASSLRYHADTCALNSDAERFDCFPDRDPNADECVKRGCCWRAPSTDDVGVPYCYFPSDYPTYQVTNQSTNGSVITSSLYNGASSFRPNMIHNLTCEQITYANGITRLRLFDSVKQRYEVPIELFDGKPMELAKPEEVKSIFGPQGPILPLFGDEKRRSGRPNPPIIFTDQFIQFSVMFDGIAAYGLGELVSPFQKNFTSWQRYALYARDHSPSPNTNLYGVHPFLMILRDDGSAFGVFFLNSNAMEVDITPLPAITFRTIGGIVDLFLFNGPTPASVIAQYHSVIAKPSMPPYWSLGFNLCRYGYANDSDIWTVIQRTIQGGFPYDVQWIDIDHMDKYLDWTVDPVKFANLSNIVQYLHSIGMRFVNIIDPAISNQQPTGTYAAYDDGHKRDLFIKAQDGSELVGKVWPGLTVFPDFTHPEATDYFAQQAGNFKSLLDFDGLWLDMNEPSSFVDGSQAGCGNNSLDNPPYTPAIDGGNLKASTICASASQHLSSHYDLHSLYGYFETQVAYQALLKVMPNRRPFILTRSTFAGSGKWTNHWTGDNRSIWSDLEYSIAQVLNFNMFGIPFVGADVCGFIGNTNEELCTRWMQAGAFYPFMRNHNDLNNAPQDPAVFSQAAQSIMRNALYARYEMLPYLYTLLYRAHVNGSMVAQPLLFAFPKDEATHSIADQFLWGDGFMISPVLQRGAVSRSVYFPNATWYVGAGGSRVNARAQRVLVDAPLAYLPLHIRGGVIIPCQLPALTTETARQKPFFIIVPLDEYTQAADGELFMDDGVSQGTVESGRYSLIKFSAKDQSIHSEAVVSGYVPTLYSTVLQQVTVLGVKTAPQTVTVNKAPAVFTYLANQVLVVNTFVNLLSPVDIVWK